MAQSIDRRDGDKAEFAASSADLAPVKKGRAGARTIAAQKWCFRRPFDSDQWSGAEPSGRRLLGAVIRSDTAAPSALD